MKLNSKGYTLIEMLAAVAIMAILAGTAVVSYTRYQEKVRQDAYAAMEKSAFLAAQSYILDKGIFIPIDNDNGELKKEEYTDIKIQTLIDGKYLQTLEDPIQKNTYCHTGSTVRVSKRPSDGTMLEKYIFRVTIKCKKYTSSGVVFES